MSKNQNAPKSVNDATFNATLNTLYSDLIQGAGATNAENLGFILELAALLNSKAITQADAQEQMKSLAKGISIAPAVRHSHVSSVTVAALIVEKHMAEIYDIKAEKVLSLAVRVLCDKKAKGAKAHINASESFKALDEETLSKAESASRDKGEEIKDEIAAASVTESITLESILDHVDIYLKAQDLKTLTTSELEKLSSVMARLNTVAKNTKAIAKA